MSLQYILLVLAVLGAIDLADRGVRVCAVLFPRVFSIQARGYKVLSGALAVRAFNRGAQGARIEEVLNQTAFYLQQYLPKGWVRRARVKWVRRSAASYVHNGTVVLRMRPSVDNDENLVNAIWAYFGRSLFPNTSDLIPEELRNAVALSVTRCGLEARHSYLLREFDDLFLKTQVATRQEVLNKFSELRNLNEFGLLMGPFLREVDRAADLSRFRASRSDLPEVFEQILDHMLAFQPLLRHNKPDDEWIYRGPYGAYSFILVSKPPQVRPRVEAYVRRARLQAEAGVGRIYIVGRQEERDFVSRVVEEILAIRGIGGLEVYSLFRDYRGGRLGIGATLAIDEVVSQLKLLPASAPTLSIEERTPGGIADVVGEVEGERNALAATVEDIVTQLSDYEGHWIPLALFGIELRKQIPDFNPKFYGGRNMMSVLKALNVLEFQERGAGTAKSVYIRLLNGD